VFLISALVSLSLGGKNLGANGGEEEKRRRRKKEEGRRKKEEERRRKKDEGRKTKEERRRKKDEGRMKKEEDSPAAALTSASSFILPALRTCITICCSETTPPLASPFSST